MKNFRKFISSNKRNNRKLFLQLTVIAFFAITSLLVWQTSAQMKAETSEENTQVRRFSFIGANLQTAIPGTNSANNSPLIPTLGTYPNTTVAVGANTTVTPNVAPTSTTSINVSTNSNFKGTFVANSTTGVVRITNAHPAGSYLVTVKAFDAMGMTTRTFTLTVVSGTVCNGIVQFTNAANVSVAAIPYSGAIGDFNNDGNQDFATGSGGNTVSIRLGNGLGGFSGTTQVSVGASPQGVAIGDFNNDGNQDVAAANFLDGTVSIRLGDGSGGFSGITNVSVGTAPQSVAIGDFNNDGNQDFAAANGSAATVSIRLGDGAGNFSGTTNVSCWH